MRDNRQPYTGREPVVLIISPFEDDHVRLRPMLGDHRCRAARTCRQGVTILREHEIPIAICERDLPDGTWKDVLGAFALQCEHPRLIVTSRLADDYLWAEVLNLGGFDVLPKPLNAQEVERVIDAAWRDWSRPQFRRTRVATASCACVDAKKGSESCSPA